MGRFAGLGRAEVDLPEELEPVAAYLADVLADAAPLPCEELQVRDALGRVLGEDIAAPTSLPAFPNAAMDGYAVRAVDLSTAHVDHPVTLAVIGEVAAGQEDPVPVRPGTAVAIMTGAPVPPGADAIVPVEMSSGRGDSVRIHERPRRGQHIRRVGEDVRAGTRMLAAGRLLTPAAVAVAAGAGRATVRCHRRPTVTVVSTGDELVPAGEPLGPGKLHDSNGPMLAALARSEGATVVQVGPIGDDAAALRDAIATAASTSDVVLLSGGVSAGAHDHLPEVLAELGSCRRARLAMKPGKPQVLARLEGCVVLGLPGNPVSSFVSFELFALPLLRTLAGRAELQRPLVVATAASDLHGSPGKLTFLRVRLRVEGDDLLAEPAGGQGSHLLSTLAEADGLAEVPADVDGIATGDPVQVRLLTDLATGRQVDR